MLLCSVLPRCVTSILHIYELLQLVKYTAKRLDSGFTLGPMIE